MQNIIMHLMIKGEIGIRFVLCEKNVFALRENEILMMDYFVMSNLCLSASKIR